MKEGNSIRKVFLDDLPKKEGFGVNKDKTVVDWKKSVGYNIKFIYDDIQGIIKIVEYNTNTHKLTVAYKDYELVDICITLIYKCKLGSILKYEIYKYYYDENNPKRIDLRNLQLNGKGIDWSEVANQNKTISFYYDGIIGMCKVIKYDGRYLYIKYKDYDYFKISTGSFILCKLKGLLKYELYEKQYTYNKSNPRRANLQNLPLNSSGIDWSKVATNKSTIPFSYDDIVGSIQVLGMIMLANLIPGFLMQFLIQAAGKKTQNYQLI